jgi:hypothetical protein
VTLSGLGYEVFKDRDHDLDLIRINCVKMSDVALDVGAADHAVLWILVEGGGAVRPVHVGTTN